MRYLGGKSRIAREIADVVAPRGLWWEPFCGGLSVSVQLAKYGPGVVSDINPALIALYRAVRDGWEPPTTITRAEYEAARTLPDSDPRKAFVGFGCSFRGKWFAGYAPDRTRLNLGPKRQGAALTRDQPARAASKSLQRDLARLHGCAIRCASFFDVAPGALPVEAIYCDPPYPGTTSYEAVGVFDHAAFWQRCAQWADGGARVFVSELGCPIPSVLAWQRPHVHLIGGAASEPRAERLFRVLPTRAAEAAP